MLNIKSEIQSWYETSASGAEIALVRLANIAVLEWPLRPSWTLDLTHQAPDHQPRVSLCPEPQPENKAATLCLQSGNKTLIWNSNHSAKTNDCNQWLQTDSYGYYGSIAAPLDLVFLPNENKTCMAYLMVDIGYGGLSQFYIYIYVYMYTHDTIYIYKLHWLLCKCLPISWVAITWNND